MSETETTPPGTTPQAGAGTPSSVTAPATSVATPVDAELVAPGDNVAGGLAIASHEPTNEPGKPLGDAAPSLQELQGKLCPNCTVGVLYVTRYDPNALHEAGQAIPNWVSAPALPPGHESGGAYDVRCFNCEYTQSIALNPGPNVGKVR